MVYIVAGHGAIDGNDFKALCNTDNPDGGELLFPVEETVKSLGMMENTCVSACLSLCVESQ